jgi:lysophospholipase L1-like esterase
LPQYRSTVVASVLFLASVAVSALPPAHARERLGPVSRAWIAAVGATTADEEAPALAQPPPPEPPAKRAYVVAVIGDSITDFRSHGGGYVRTLASMCPKSRFDGYGVGGQRASDLRARFQEELFARGKPPYTHVIIEGGVNDLLVGTMDDARLAAMEGDFAAMYAMARARGVEVISLTVPAFLHATRLQLAMDDALDDFMIANAPRAVDLRDLLGCKDDAGAVCPAFRRVPQDSVHWNARGHELVAAALRDAAFADCE